jgi:hypothetical protein
VNTVLNPIDFCVPAEQTRGKLLLHFIDVNSTLAEVELVLTFFSPGSFFVRLFLLLDWDWIRVQNSAP